MHLVQIHLVDFLNDFNDSLLQFFTEFRVVLFEKRSGKNRLLSKKHVVACAIIFKSHSNNQFRSLLLPRLSYYDLSFSPLSILI